MPDHAVIPDAFSDLLDADVATMATIGPEGRPQLSAVWFVHRDGDIVSLHVGRQKTKNLERNPAVNLFILDSANPQRYLEIRGDADLEPDPDYAFATEVGAKYGGADLRSFDGDDQRRVRARIIPRHVVAVDLSH